MVSKTVNIAIMFADIAGSTKLYDTLGDQVARVKVATSIETMSKIISQHHGILIKTIGDEVMCTFNTAEDAGNAAWKMQETFEEKADVCTDGSPVAVRIGMHFGSAILEDNDVFGDAVNVAARMVAQAKAKQIITTQKTLDKLPISMQGSTRFVDHAPIKGKQEDIDIFEIIWQEEDVTHMVTSMAKKKTTLGARLSLSYNGETLELSKKRPGLIIGRSQNCDLTINEKLASRQHVRIELRREKFFIVDQSTNGTHVLIDGVSEEYLRREEMPLSGNGRISLSGDFSKNPSEVVEFKLT